MHLYIQNRGILKMGGTTIPSLTQLGIKTRKHIYNYSIDSHNYEDYSLITIKKIEDFYQ